MFCVTEQWGRKSLLISGLGQRQHYQLVGSRVKNKRRNHLASYQLIHLLCMFKLHDRVHKQMALFSGHFGVAGQPAEPSQTHPALLVSQIAVTRQTAFFFFFFGRGICF